MNANTWIKVPGAPTYEVSTEAEPRVRNKRTGRVIAENRRTVDIYLKDRKKKLRRTKMSLLYFALSGIDVRKANGKTRGFSVEWDGTKFLVKTSEILLEKARAVNPKLRMRYDDKTRERLLKETAQFMASQEEAARTGRTDRLLGFLSGHMEYAGQGVRKTSRRATLTREEIEEGVKDAALEICSMAAEGVPFLNHPARAMANMAGYMIRKRRATASVLDVERVNGKLQAIEYKQNNEV